MRAEKQNLRTQPPLLLLLSPHKAAELVCLVRASDGKTKISTAVSAKDHGRFAESYGTILRAQMDGLKKKAKRPKAKA